MPFENRINQIMDYVEDHLQEELDPTRIAALAGCSFQEFQRCFSLLNELSFLEYVRKRRLSCAAVELLHSEKTLMDIAIAYGYTSADSFAAAFRACYGCSPSAARKTKQPLALFHPRHFALHIEAEQALPYHVEQKEALQLCGFSVLSSRTENRSIAFWRQVKDDGSFQALCAHAKTAYSYGVCFGFDAQGNNRYLIAVEGTQRGNETYTLPAATWLVFEKQGPLSQTLAFLWERIYQEILPASGYDKHPYLPTVERYEAGDCEREDYRIQIWIPIDNKRKKKG